MNMNNQINIIIINSNQFLQRNKIRAKKVVNKKEVKDLSKKEKNLKIYKSLK